MFLGRTLPLLAALAAAAPVAAEDLGHLPALVGLGGRDAADPHTGLALGGFDPVSFVLDPAPRPGLPAFELVLDGRAWRFASAANRAAFAADPEAFRPRLGGFDAAAVVAGRLAGANPLLHALADGRLYLFRDGEGRRLFLADPGAPARAEARWPALRDGPGRD